MVTGTTIYRKYRKSNSYDLISKPNFLPNCHIKLNRTGGGGGGGGGGELVVSAPPLRSDDE